MSLFKKINNTGFSIVEVLILIVFAFGFAYIVKNVYSYSKTGSEAAVVAVASSNPISFTIYPSVIGSGDAARVSWSSASGSTCYASDSWSGTKAAAGTNVIGPFTTGSKIVKRYVIQCIIGKKSSSTSADLTVVPIPATPLGCNNNPASSSNDPTYTYRTRTIFNSTTLPSYFQNYYKKILPPGGFIDGIIGDNHLIPTAKGLIISAFPDQKNYPGSTGTVGAGFDLDGSNATANEIPGSGGFDVCFSTQTGSWQNPAANQTLNLVIIAWPVDGVWKEGEIDFFEGNPQSPAINVHEIGPNPAHNWNTATTWPAGIGNGGAHMISARWDPANGYRFWLDGSLISSATILPTSPNSTDCITGNAAKCITVPTTPHHLSIQLQDINQNSPVSKSATIYWTATYGYSG